MVWIIDPISGRARQQQRDRGTATPEACGCRDADIERLVAIGKKLAAIKLYLERHRVDLGTAKRAVEEVADRLESAGP